MASENYSKKHQAVLSGTLIYCSRDLVNGDEQWKNGIKITKNGEPTRVLKLTIGVPKEQWQDPNSEVRRLWDLSQLCVSELGAHWDNSKLSYDKGFYDGDTDVDLNGKPFSDRDGWAGMIAVSCKARWEEKPRWVYQDTHGEFQHFDGNKCRPGDYVQVALSVQARYGDHQARLFELTGIWYLGKGPREIKIPRGNDGVRLFKSAPPLPPGFTKMNSQGGGLFPTAPVAAAMAPTAPVSVAMAPTAPVADAMAPTAPVADAMAPTAPGIDSSEDLPF